MKIVAIGIVCVTVIAVAMIAAAAYISVNKR